MRQPGEATALHLTDGSGVFIAVEAVDVETGAASVVNPRNFREQLVTGLIVPVASLRGARRSSASPGGASGTGVGDDF